MSEGTGPEHRRSGRAQRIPNLVSGESAHREVRKSLEEEIVAVFARKKEIHISILNRDAPKDTVLLK